MWAYRAAAGVAVVVLVAALVVVAYGLLGRFVLHGRVTARSLDVAVSREAGGGAPLPCKQADGAATWRCSVENPEGSGAVDYHVPVRDGSSCWDATAVTTDEEGRLPRRASGCVHAWQWSVFSVAVRS